MGTVTISGNAVLVYGDEAGSRTYWKTQLGGTAWEASSLRKEALVSATRWMDSVGLTDASGNAIEPLADDSTIPEDVINACYELANALLTDPSIRTTFTTGGLNNKRLKAGSAEIEYFRPIDGGVFPPHILRLLRDYLGGGTSASGANSGNQAFGTDVCQPFTSARKPGLTEGWS